MRDHRSDALPRCRDRSLAGALTVRGSDGSPLSSRERGRPSGSDRIGLLCRLIQRGWRPRAFFRCCHLARYGQIVADLLTQPDGRPSRRGEVRAPEPPSRPYIGSPVMGSGGHNRFRRGTRSPTDRPGRPGFLRPGALHPLAVHAAVGVQFPGTRRTTNGTVMVPGARLREERLDSRLLGSVRVRAPR